VTTERGRRLQPELRIRCDARQSGPEATLAHADGRAVRGHGGTARPGPSWPCGCRRTDALHEVTGADTADADAEHADTDPGTPDVHTGQWTADRGHHMRGHWTFTRTPDTGRVDATEYADSRQGTAGIRTDILDHHDHPTARWDAEPWTCGRHLRHSATMTARRRDVPASARLPTALPGACSVAPSAKPRLGALLSSDEFRVESRAGGRPSSVMAPPYQVSPVGSAWVPDMTWSRGGRGLG
jgi:hypothetical protein